MSTHISNSINEQITDIIISKFECSKEQVTPEAEFSTDLGFDSLDQIEFIMAIEEAFNINVPDDDAEQIKTVQQAFEKIEQATQVLS